MAKLFNRSQTQTFIAAPRPSRRAKLKRETVLLYCVTKQCLGVYLSFVTDVHLSFVTGPKKNGQLQT